MNKTKIIALLMSCLMVIGIFPGIALAENTCEHIYEVVKEEAATCLYPAYVWEKCTLCGNEFGREVGEPSETHENIRTETVEASCVKEGSKKEICKDCGETVSEETLPVNDSHAIINGKCLLCGVEETCEHDYVVVKELEATCIEPAYVWTECSLCGVEKNYEVGEADGEHDYVVVKELEATCIEAGYVWTECSVCGAEKNYEVGEATNMHIIENGACIDCGMVPAEFNCEHENAYVRDTKAADCYYTGVELWKCPDCRATYTVELPVTGIHDYADGVCTVCGEKEPVVEEPEAEDPEREEPEVDETEDMVKSYMPYLFNVMVEFGKGGKINAPDTFLIAPGANRTIHITPEDGFRVADVIVNGISVGAGEMYTIEDAAGDYKIEVIFEKIPA